MIKDIKLAIMVVKETLNDPDVNMALAAYRNNMKQIRALYKHAVDEERKVFGKLVVNKAKAIYIKHKLENGDYETIFD